MLEAILTGIVQGVTEWLPISSEGALALIKTAFFGSGDTSAIFRQILFLHLGTFFAALIYLRKDVQILIKALLHYRSSDAQTQKTITFLALSTLISGILGIILLKFFISTYENLELSSQTLILVIGFLLLITAYLQLRIKQGNTRTAKDLTLKDAIILGIAQGFSALPGLSRSGLTVSFLLLRRLDKKDALRLSFLMSLPIVLGGNILLNLKNFELGTEDIVSFVVAFIFGLLTIQGLFNLAQKINFGYFVFVFGLLTIVSAFI